VSHSFEEQKTIDQLIQLEVRWMDAWKKQDRKSLEEILAPGFILTSVTTDDLIDRTSWLSGLQRVLKKEFSFKDFHVKLYGDSAVVRSKFHQIATLDSSDFSGEFIFTDTFVLIDGRWQAVARHSSWSTKRTTGGRMGANQ
jgi:hypothetical protein